MSIIQVNDLNVKYERVHALKDVCLEIEQHEFLGIIGPNGGGKTTLMKSLLGIVKPQSGAISFNHGVVMGYVPQQTSFDRDFPITVGEVILTSHLPKKVKLFYPNKKHNIKHAKDVMTSLGIWELFDCQIGKLSGGQMQKVLIARALMTHPNVLILDEPTAGVDVDSRANIYEMLKVLNEKMTIIIVSHNADELAPYLDRVIYINQKAHVHSSNTLTSETNSDNCPIDWFVRGKEINETFTATKQ